MTVDYEMRLPDYLAKCINRDLPELHCNGQCVLMKKIKETEKEEKKKNLMVYEYSSLYMHKENTVFSMHQPKEETIQTHFSLYLMEYRFSYHTSLFRPPIC